MFVADTKEKEVTADEVPTVKLFKNLGEISLADPVTYISSLSLSFFGAGIEQTPPSKTNAKSQIRTPNFLHVSRGRLTLHHH